MHVHSTFHPGARVLHAGVEPGRLSGGICPFSTLKIFPYPQQIFFQIAWLPILNHSLRASSLLQYYGLVWQTTSHYNTFPHIQFFFKKKTYQIIHFLYHIIYYSNKKNHYKTNFSIFQYHFFIFPYQSFFFLIHEQCIVILCGGMCCHLPNTLYIFSKLGLLVFSLTSYFSLCYNIFILRYYISL